MNTNPQCYIISAYRDGYQDAHNQRRHKQLGIDLQSIGATLEVIGCYLGSEERSYLVIPTGFEDSEAREEIIRLTQDYGQECALYLDANRGAYFVDGEGNSDYQGQFVSATRPEAFAQDGYTYVPSTDKFFIIKPRIAGAIGAYAAISGGK
jgi:hypothetical protein